MLFLNGILYPLSMYALYWEARQLAFAVSERVPIMMFLFML